MEKLLSAAVNPRFEIEILDFMKNLKNLQSSEVVHSKLDCEILI